MPNLTRMDIEDAYLLAKAMFDTWREQAAAEAEEPYMVDRLKKAINLTPEEVFKRAREGMSESARKTLDDLLGMEE